MHASVLPETSLLEDDAPRLSKAQRRRQRVKETKRKHREALLNAKNVDLWRIFKSYADPRSEPLPMTADRLLPVFDVRMNAPVVPPEGEDSVHRALTRALSALVPHVTIDLTPERFFSALWSDDEVTEVKYALQKGGLDSAVGWDDCSYEYVLSIPNLTLGYLFNTALLSRTVPGRWLTTLLVGALKRGKNADLPESYRTIGLECVLLKFLTLLIDKRVRAWADATGRLPATQNGFRPGFRTNNNAFILRCAAERAAAEGKKLYVASVDLANAFPSVDRPLLWVKLQGMGMQGPIFDLYRHIYENMAYIVRANKKYSHAFTSDIGVLIGDPASPMMWNLFFADFSLPASGDDIRLAGRPVSHLEHADDVIIMSTTPDGLQRHLHALSAWAARSFVTINVEKTWGIIPGGDRLRDVFLHLNNRGVEFKADAKYVGIHLTTENARLYRNHYTEQRKKAKRVAGLCFAVQGLTGALPVETLKTVYMGRVDPHLISGADVCPDAVHAHVRELEDVQILFLRRMLGLGSRSCLTPLFSETGLWPIRHRRADLAVGYLKYCLRRPDDHIVRLALRDSAALARLGSLSWYGDLQIAVRHLGADLPCGLAVTDDAATRCADKIRRGLLAKVHADFEVSPKLVLLRGPSGHNRVGRAGTAIAYRPYLDVVKKTHRRALIRLLVSGHGLAVETLRWKTRTQDAVPREQRICRLCGDSVEDEIHALFECIAHPGLVAAKHRVAEHVARIGAEDVWRVAMCSGDFSKLIQYMITTTERASVLARYVHDVLQTFAQVPLRLPV